MKSIFWAKAKTPKFWGANAIGNLNQINSDFEQKRVNLRIKETKISKWFIII